MNDYLTTAEAAARLGLKPDTVRRYCDTGKIACVKWARDWRIPPEALATFAATRQIGPGWPKGRPRTAPPDPQK